MVDHSEGMTAAICIELINIFFTHLFFLCALPLIHEFAHCVFRAVLLSDTHETYRAAIQSLRGGGINSLLLSGATPRAACMMLMNSLYSMLLLIST